MRAEMAIEGAGGAGSGRGWFVVATKPMSEETAVRTIGKLGFETYAPTVTREVTRMRKVVEVERPMFPHYVFVSLGGAREPWQRIAHCFGVSRVMTTGAPNWTLQMLPAGFVDNLREVGPTFSEPEKEETFQEGDEVLISCGRWVELVGRIKALDPHGRVRVMMRLLGGDREASVHVSQLRKLDG